MPLTVTLPQLGGSEDAWGGILNTAINAVVAEVNENADGTNAIAPNLTEGSWEISTTPVTASAADLNAIDGFAATTVTVTELGYLSGASSNIQDQINAITTSAGSGSVTSVAMIVPTGLSVSGSPITTSGTLTVSLASGYTIPQTSQIPSTSDISNWNTAYGWGDHSAQGYLTSSSLSGYATTSQTFGISQSWQTTSISVQTWYQNSSSKAELWHVRQGSGQAGTVRVGTSTSSYVTLDMRDGDSGEFIPIYFVVPPSHYFYVNGSSFASQYKLA